jgi:hypothetical protein
MFQFVGDLSREDAALLQNHALASVKILEFGAGGSTQIFAQCCPQLLVSVETSIHWLRLTGYRIDQFKKKTLPTFVKYGEYPKTEYDLIFVDGLDHLRRDFAFQSWRHLSNDGCLIFHDTRRDPDIDIAATFIKFHWNEIDSVEVNKDNSNCTVITKKKYLPYENWQETEGKKDYEYGLLSPEEEQFFDSQPNNQ